MTSGTNQSEARFDFVVVANRLPVDRYTTAEGEPGWRTSPGGLVTALTPVMERLGGAWVGWAGADTEGISPFTHNGTRIVPVPLSAEEVESYYEGFSNDTLWPLYHDVIAPPTYHREWWDSYVKVNRRFAEAAAETANERATVWVHDYQLQLVPGMLRELRPDLTIGFFNHIPFPAYGLFSQLPWRTQIIEGLLGADVIGFQRVADASNFTRAVRRLVGYETKGTSVYVPLESDSAPGQTGGYRRGGPTRHVLAKHFPISIDSASFEALARTPEVQARAAEIRSDLGGSGKILFGVDRLDYTKGIRHRLKAYGELLADGRIDPADVTLIQVASPSRERVETYRQLRDEIELTVGRINGDFGQIGHSAVHYLHHGYPREEMVALYLASDVMLVTALRDGMNLVAKEYVATRFDQDGVLVLSEFAGASDDLTQALLINPHDIEGLKDTIMTAINMPQPERAKRMKSMRKKVRENDVERWSTAFLAELERSAAARLDEARGHRVGAEQQ
ncbi:alpha,alpha-trehalose-phosphate synthase (UDP-forming) [Mycetocola lacteus]|uniref:Trehalose-6-phosphate synthase n=1 Tax=Mycetocola lacteus TaxID=76637 RepID=A0A3L7AK94_9MICO|nr:alpha,alpha-trehalose-phosphate synthase (UDP-forming) [Mycetocola lacteus]RLP80687.1 alpha,alpha-trehalose-phosphate synthase (UDP-forming) [Mycetocola lacteus]RLP84472.1 alpha,alpha-trehalose-phosphate synthase (UDP-forming) [Mycetocola lacteus]